MEVLQTSALPLGDGAGRTNCVGAGKSGGVSDAGTTAHVGTGEVRHVRFATCLTKSREKWLAIRSPLACLRAKDGAGNGIRTRDFDLGKVALYH